MIKKNKIVYIGLSADSIHHGHMNLLNKGRELGEITIGLFTDKAIASFKRLPYLNFEQRKKILLNFKGVKNVIAQETQDYSINLKKIKPDYMIHGDDWKSGNMSHIRKNCLKVLKTYGGKLVEIPYTKGVTSAAYTKHLNSISTTPDVRRGLLSRLLDSKKILRIIETHNPISAIIAENLIYEKKNENVSFDGFWSSSLTDSTALGKPDNESLSNSQRLLNIDQIFDVTTKPLIFDGDTGGQIDHLDMKIKSMERLGISAVIFEDKTGLKQNSLFQNTSNQKQEDKKKFAEKISIATKAKRSDEFMIIARIESFILGKGINDALERANLYLEAGASGIMIHSKSKNPKEIFEFSKKFKKNFPKVPLV